MENQQIRSKLTILHNKENDHNLEISKIDKQVKTLLKRKQKLARQVSKNMLYRNKLINSLIVPNG